MQIVPSRGRRASTVDITTTLSPLAHGVMCAFAAIEDPAHGAANVVFTRLLREELERVRPGAWIELLEVATDLKATTEPRAAAAAIMTATLELLRPPRKEGAAIPAEPEADRRPEGSSR